MQARRPDARRRRRTVGAVLAALFAHGALIAAWRVAGDAPRSLGAGDEGAPAPLELAEVALIGEVPEGPLVTADLGDADRIGAADTHPLPRAALDAPGHRAAAPGRDAPGRDAITGRRDLDTRSAQIWNDASRVRAARVDGDRRPASHEAITRDPARGYGDLRSRPGRARRGEADPQAGAPLATEAERDWFDADPLFDTREARPRASDGATQPGTRRPLVARGELAVDVHRRGRAADDLDSAARSSERHPGAFERTRPAAGGDSPEAGAGARRGSDRGIASAGAGRGSAATTADAAPGRPDRSVRARRSNPYFRDMYRRIDAELRFPQERALNLDSGEVILAFTLRADGHIDQLEVARSSGFADFDDEAVRALRAAAPFGRPPPALLRGAGTLRVRAPYEFANPLIR